MILAVAFDFEEPANVLREGIGVYAKHLISALMDYDDTLNLELWTFDFNLDNAKSLYASVLEKYPDRIKIFHNDTKRPLCSKEWLKYILYYYFKKNDYRIKKVFNKKRYEEKILALSAKKKAFLLALKRKQLKKMVKEISKADVVWSMFVNLKLALDFSCPKFMQVHDLFTFEHYDLFAKSWGEGLLKHNETVLDVLTEYSKTNTTFISSSEYTVREHSLKFIPNITKEQTACIPFPPLVKDFSDANCLSKEDFKNKYGIWDKYIAVPSQNRPNKNWSVILKAIARLKDKGINLQFVTTGKVGDIKTDKELACSLKIQENILELGSISEEDLYMLYKYEDIAIGSTIIEGMGISGQVIEALKVGNVPAIHSRCCGYRDSLRAVGLSEESADLNWFDCDDDETLANYMEEIIKNPQPHIEKQKHVIDAYMSITWQDVARKYMEIFEREVRKGKYE